MQHARVEHRHVDIVEEPGTYRANWACVGSMLVGLLGMLYGFSLSGRFPQLGAATMIVGAAVIVLSAARLFAGVTRWASLVTIFLGIWTWYSGALLGVNPSIFENSVLWVSWGLILLGLGYLFLGTWASLGAPGKVEWEPFFYRLES